MSNTASALQAGEPSSSKEPPPPLSRIGLNAHKAGMEGLDKDKINDIIVEASKGSKYYQNELRKDQEIMKRLDRMLQDLRTFTAAQKAAALSRADKEAEQMELSRDLTHIIVHVDMDAFYAAVEMRDNPSLKDLPMAVGSNSMLSTSNYVARRYGVRAAMPGFIARKLCPDLIIVSPNFDKYCRVGEEVKTVLSCYDPNFCPMGLDESYLDITEYVRERMRGDSIPDDCKSLQAMVGKGIKCTSYKDRTDLSLSKWTYAEHVVEELRAKIFESTGLTASAGIAPNKVLAKIASDMNKPNGQFLVEPTKDGVLDFIQELPIRKVCGIGKVTEKMLSALGIAICRDLYEKRDILFLLFSPSSFHFFLSTSLGLGGVDIQKTRDRKGISTQRSFHEMSDPIQLMGKCFELCKALAEDMVNEKIKGHTVTIKLKTVDFVVRSRALTLSRPMSTCHELYNVARQLLQQEVRACQPRPLALRLMGVRVSSLMASKSNERPTHQESLASFFRPTDLIQSSSIVTETTNPDPSANEGLLEVLNICPVCAAEVSTDNQGLNQHIDTCLNRAAIQEAVEEFKNFPHNTAVWEGGTSNCKRARIEYTPLIKEKL